MKLMKKAFIATLVILGILFILLLIWPEDEKEYDGDYQTHEEEKDDEEGEDRTEEGSHEQHTREAVSGDGTATILIYMIGSDLESDGGCATQDLYEICDADLGSGVNVIVQTGGAYYWQNPQISGDSVQRFAVQDGELSLKKDVGLVSMVEPETVRDFLVWGTQNYPADRYGLIFWNHGGGTILGFGADEHFPDDMLSLDEIADALDGADVHMEFVGFDACLMGTIETAYMLEPYADYMIASEETEPGTGWYYTDWLTAFGRNPSMDMERLGKQIIDDFVDGPDSFFWDDTTLALVDLSQIPALYSTLCTYMAESRECLSQNAYRQIMYARSDAKSYGEGEYEQIDIADYVEEAGIDGGDAVKKALDKAVVYFNSSISHSSGLAMYYPYDYPEYYEDMLVLMNEIGFSDGNYQGFFNDFVSLLVYGQYCGRRSLSPMEQLTGYEEETSESIDYGDTSWYDAEIGEQIGDGLVTLDTGELYIAEKGDDFVLQLTDEQWDTITVIEQQVFVDDGEGYIDLGSDNVYEFDDDGDLLIDFDYLWVALDGIIVPFYAVEEGDRADGGWYSYGYVPAELHRKDTEEPIDVEVMVYWDSEHEDGYVAGYRPVSEDGLNLPAKNYPALQAGDVLYFYCDYYTYDGAYDASYYLGDPLTVTEADIQVSYEDIGEVTTNVCYYLMDMYQNEYWTETIEIYFE